jgi:ribonuclease R
MDDLELERAIVDLVRRPTYRPVKPRVIAQQLGVPKSRWPEVKKAVKRLVIRGELGYGSNHLVQAAGPAGPKSNRVVGVFRRAEGGFGFVRPSGAAASETEIRDIYIPADKSGDASRGDIVAVRLVGEGGRPRPGPRGEIVEIVERQTNRFVGTYFEYRGSGQVQIDGPLFTKPISVDDPGARGAEPNDKVVVEMVRFPSQAHRGEGVIVEVLGPRGKPGVDTLSIIREFGLHEEFAEDALEDARRQAEAFDESIPPDRLDATGETIVTIDPIDARDFDDAISLVRLDSGHWRLGVHIADVAHFVRPKSALGREARDRATSVYLPDRVIPMLPELISNGLASLQPGKVRYTKTVYMEFTADGLRVASEMHRAAIRSRKRLAYEQVDEFIQSPDHWRRRLGAEVCDLLSRMRELAAVLRRRRMARGALELVMPEVKVVLDKQGGVAGAQVVKNTESHQIIEEFMVAANEAVAEMLQEKGIPFLRRIHQAPVPRKLRDLAGFVAELGLPSRDLESRPGLQKLLGTVAGRPEQHAVNYAMLRSLPRAVYSPKEEGHFALASECYCHFTSPIRRYPDLTIHRLVDAVLSDGKPARDFDKLVVLGEHCSGREQRADAAERELTKVKLLAYLSERIGEEMDALITGVESFGLFVQGVELPAEGLIRVDSLVDDYYRFDRATHTLAGNRSGNTFRLGDLVRVAVARVDLERRELDFRLVGRRPHPAATTTPAAAGKPEAAAARRPKPPAPKRVKRTPEVRKRSARVSRPRRKGRP